MPFQLFEFVPKQCKHSSQRSQQLCIFSISLSWLLLNKVILLWRALKTEYFTGLKRLRSSILMAQFLLPLHRMNRIFLTLIFSLLLSGISFAQDEGSTEKKPACPQPENKKAMDLYKKGI